MNVMTSLLRYTLILSLAGLAIARAAEEKEAKVANGVSESSLSTVTLTEAAVKRLAIATVAVEKRPVADSRLYGGELTLPNDAPAEGDEGQSLFSLLPQMTPSDLIRLAESQIDADGVVDAAKVELEAAEVEVRRAEQLLQQKVGSEKAVDLAQARADLAASTMKAAQAKRQLLGSPVLASRPPEKLWLKVAVYVGEVGQIDLSAPAIAGPLSGRPDPNSKKVSPVTTAPPSANPATATVDLFYSIENPDRSLRPGQRMGVTLPLLGEAESLVIPYAAVIYDVNGGSWVYQNTGPQTYVRARIEISRVVGDLAVLGRGPAPGVMVVTDGAAELFGTEFGTGK